MVSISASEQAALELDRAPRGELDRMGAAIADAIGRALVHRADNPRGHGVGTFLAALARSGYTVVPRTPAKARPAKAGAGPAGDPFVVPPQQ